MAEEAKRDFPELKDEDIEPFIITRSTYNKGFDGIRFFPKTLRKKAMIKDLNWISTTRKPPPSDFLLFEIPNFYV